MFKEPIHRLMEWKIHAYYVSDLIVISTTSNLWYPLTQLPGPQTIKPKRSNYHHTHNNHVHLKNRKLKKDLPVKITRQRKKYEFRKKISIKSPLFLEDCRLNVVCGAKQTGKLFYIWRVCANTVPSLHQQINIKFLDLRPSHIPVFSSLLQKSPITAVNGTLLHIKKKISGTLTEKHAHNSDVS